LSLEASLARAGGWGSQLYESHIKRKGPLMQRTECSSVIPSNEETIAISTGNYKFLQNIGRRLFEMSFINGPFSLRLLCNQKF
jgi:hypothetical protein